MGFLFKFVFLSLTFPVVIYFVPGLVDIKPQPINIPEVPFTGQLAPNEALTKATVSLEDKIDAPECLEMRNKTIYTGVRDGRIMKIEGNVVQEVAKLGDFCDMWRHKKCSRPLGLRFDKSGTLWVADAYRGLVKVNVETGKFSVIVPFGEIIDGEPMMLPDDLDIDDNGIIYMSDASTKWDLGRLGMSTFEHEHSGRILRIDPVKKSVSVLIKGFAFANGVQISHDKKSLIFTETFERRVNRYYFEGAKKGKWEVLTQLPAHPDNIRVSNRGGYWVPIPFGPIPPILDKLQSCSVVRRFTARFLDLVKVSTDYVLQHWQHPLLTDINRIGQAGGYLCDLFPKYGLVVEIDGDGRILRSLHDPTGRINVITHVTEDQDGTLYFGSVLRPGIRKLKL